MTTRRITEHLPFGEKRDPRFFGQDILSVSQFDRDDLDTLFARRPRDARAWWSASARSTC